MDTESQAALMALEHELDRLRAAVEHIEQAKTVAQNVVASVGAIQKKYAEHLDALLDVQKEAVREAGAVRQERFDELSASARKHILESAARAKKYLEEYNNEMIKGLEATGETAGLSLRTLTASADGVIAETGAQMRQQLTEVLGGVQAQFAELASVARTQFGELNDTASELILAGSSNAARQIDEIAGRAAAALQGLDTRARSHVDELAALGKESLREIMASTKEHIEEAGNQSKRIFAAIKKTQDQQTTEFEKVTVSADALIAASGKLVRTIDSIDFPARLQSIEGDIRSLHYNLNTTANRIDALAKSNEAAMASFGEDVIAKLGRLEMFTEKAVRTQGDETEKRFREQETQVRNVRLLVVVVLVLNVLIAAGVFLLWNGRTETLPSPAPQIVHDTVLVPQPAVEEKTPRGRRR